MAGPTVAGPTELVLYYSVPSFYSQKVRLVLAEKELTYKSRLIDLAAFENCEPWFMKICSSGQVPVLQHGRSAISDSTRILTYIEDTFDAAKLVPDLRTEYGRNVGNLTSVLDSIQIAVITMGTMKFPELAPESQALVSEEMKIRHANQEKVVDHLAQLKEKNPALVQVYTAKIESIKKFLSIISKEQQVKRAISHMAQVLQQVDRRLEATESAFPGTPTWLCGEAFTAADVCLAVTLNRLQNLGLFKTHIGGGKIPRLEKYFKRLQERKSYQEVFVDPF